jgi:PKD repeat protein
MQPSRLLILAGLSLLISSCTKKPEAVISTESTSIIIGEDISFKNASENAESYKWEFGDGTTSSIKEPTHNYKKTGNFTVRLTAYSKKEKKNDIAELSISVNPEFPEGSSAIKFKGAEYPLYTNCYLFAANNYTLTGVGNNGNLICNVYLPGQPQETKTYNLQSSTNGLSPDEACVIIQEKISGSNDVLWASNQGELKVTIKSGKASAWFSKIDFVAGASTIESSGQTTCP